MSTSLKFSVAQVIAKKIVDNPTWFPELVKPASGMLTTVYWNNWKNRPGEWDRDPDPSNFWPQLKARLPEILHKFSLDKDAKVR